MVVWAGFLSVHRVIGASGYRCIGAIVVAWRCVSPAEIVPFTVVLTDFS